MVFIVLFFLLLEVLSFRIIIRIMRSRPLWLKVPVLAVHAYTSLLFPVLLILYRWLLTDKDSLWGQRILMILILLLTALYIPRIVGALIYLPGWIFSRIFRIRRICDIFAGTALFVSLSLSVIVFYGHFVTRFNYKVEAQEVPLRRLPPAFDGFTIVHISDLHLSGFFGHGKKLSRAINIINEQKPDALVITGDWVSIQSDEMRPFIDLLRDTEAPYKLGVLGNHDYGLYDKELSLAEQLADRRLLERHIRYARFRLLNDEHIFLERGEDTLVIAGVENWGKMPFPQYGNLKQTLQGLDRKHPVVLLSHDPSHWRAEILPQTRVDLTLSGHTHGAQFGIRLWGFTWSPIQRFYKEWGGLYAAGPRYLYVNRGLGTLGLPARIGMRPEITVLTLTKAERNNRRSKKEGR